MRGRSPGDDRSGHLVHEVLLATDRMNSGSQVRSLELGDLQVFVQDGADPVHDVRVLEGVNRPCVSEAAASRVTAR
jgi:hypothetical protein